MAAARARTRRMAPTLGPVTDRVNDRRGRRRRSVTTLWGRAPRGSDLGLGVLVVLVRAHRLAGRALPLRVRRPGASRAPWPSRGRAPGRSRNTSRCSRSRPPCGRAANSAISWRDSCSGSSSYGKRRRRGEVGLLGAWSGRRPAARRRSPSDGLAHLDRDRQLLLGAVQAVHADDVGAGVARACGAHSAGESPSYEPAAGCSKRHRHHDRQPGRLRALDEQQRLAEVGERLADPEVRRPGVELFAGAAGRTARGRGRRSPGRSGRRPT